MPRISHNPYSHKIYVPQTKKNSYYQRNKNPHAQTRKLNHKQKQAQQEFDFLNEFARVKQFSLLDQLALCNRYPRNAVEYLIFLSLVCLIGRVPTAAASSHIPQEKFNTYTTLELGTQQQFNMAVSLVDSASMLTPVQQYHACSSALLGYEVYGYSLSSANLERCVTSLSNIRRSLNVIGLHVGFGQFIAHYRNTHEQDLGTRDVFQFACDLLKMEAEQHEPTFSSLEPLLYVKSSIQRLYVGLDDQVIGELEGLYQPALDQLHKRHAVYDLPPNIESYTSAPWGSLSQYKAALTLSSVLTVADSPRELQEDICSIIEIGKIPNHMSKIRKKDQDPLFSSQQLFPLRSAEYAMLSCPTVFLNYYSAVQTHLKRPKIQTHFSLFVYAVREMDKVVALEDKMIASSIFTFTDWMELELKNPEKSFVGNQFIKFTTDYLNKYGTHFDKFDFELPKLQQQFELVKAKYLGDTTKNTARDGYISFFGAFIASIIFAAYWRRQNHIEPIKKNDRQAQTRPEEKVKRKRKMSQIEGTMQLVAQEEHIDATALLRDIDANLKEIVRLIDQDTLNDEELNRRHVILEERHDLLLSLKNSIEANEELNKLSLAAYQGQFDALAIDNQFILEFVHWHKKISNYFARISQREKEAEIQEKSEKQASFAEAYANNQRFWRDGHNSAGNRTKNEPVTQVSPMTVITAAPAAAISLITSTPRNKVDTSSSFFRPRRPSDPTFSFAELFPVRPDMIYLQNARKSLECMHILCVQDKQGFSKRQVQLGLLYNLMRFHHIIGIFQRRYSIRNLPIGAETAYTIRNMIRHGYFIEEYNEFLVPYAMALHKTFYVHLIAVIEKGASLFFPSLKYTKVMPFAADRNEDIKAYQQDQQLIVEDIRASLKIMGALYKFRTEVPFDEDVSLHSAIKMLINIIGENLKLVEKTDIFDMPEWKCLGGKQRSILLKTKYYANLIGHHFDKEGEAIKEQQAQSSTARDEPAEQVFEEITLPQLEEIAQMAMNLMDTLSPKMDVYDSSRPSSGSLG
jgi:hypothetical protein